MAVGSEKLLKKMRLRLTMQNLGVVALIFVILTTITYVYLDYSIYNTKQGRIQAVAHAMTENDWTPRRPARENNHRPNLGYLHIDADGSLLRAAPHMPFEIGDWQEFVALAEEESGHMNFDDMTIYYAWSTSPYGMRVIAFESDVVEQMILDNIFWTFIIASLCALIVFFLMSRYLAGKAIQPIEVAWTQQKAFIADASHELRTPLTVIRTNLDIVEDCPDETVAEQSMWLTNIREETDAMKELVEQLFFLAQADTHQQHLDRMVFDYSDMLSSAVCAYTPMASEKGIDLIAKIAEGVTIYGDDGKLRRVLRVLVENALRHTEAGGSVTVCLTEEAKMYRLDVIDTGEGIDKEAIGHLFERFYQADSSRAKGGAGLGLSIAKWIVEAHGGTIGVTSTLGEGATFTVRLPRAEGKKQSEKSQRKS